MGSRETGRFIEGSGRYSGSYYSKIRKKKRLSVDDRKDLEFDE